MRVLVIDTIASEAIAYLTEHDFHVDKVESTLAPDIDACSRKGVVVVNAPYGNVVSAAEHTVGMLLALVRKIRLIRIEP